MNRGIIRLAWTWLILLCGSLGASAQLVVALPCADTAQAVKPTLSVSAYVDVYAALSTDSVSTEFIKFPTVAPRRNQVGLNMLYLGAKYESEKARMTAGIHVGDIAESAWSHPLNLVQEANVGIRLRPKLWLDGGLFRTHIGLESIQPRENLCESISLVDYFEPYYLSGLKLTYQVSKRLALQVNGFNGFNGFVEPNHKKAFGATAIYQVDSVSSLYINFLTTDESPDTLAYGRRLGYWDAYYFHPGKRWDWGAEANFALQAHSRLGDSTRSATVFSAQLVAKRKFNGWAAYVRGEVFEDSDEVLTGPVENDHHQLVGINTVGGTLGIECRPMPKSYLRLEGRYLHATENEHIFYHGGRYYQYRVEGIFALGVWI